MKRKKYQFGHVTKQSRKSGPAVWVIRFHALRGGKPRYVNWRLGTTTELPTKKHVESAAQSARVKFNSSGPVDVDRTLSGLIERYKADKMPRRYSTRSSYLSLLSVHVVPTWGEYTLEQIAKEPYKAEKWCEELKLAPRTQGHVKALMHRLFECAMKWGILPLGRNPMELVEIEGVTRRLKLPRVLNDDEFSRLIAELKDPYRTMVLTVQCLGLRVSELMALQWPDFDFNAGTMLVQRGIVHGRVDEVKTEYLHDALPLDPHCAAMLPEWRQKCPATPDGWLFPNPSNSQALLAGDCC